MAWAYARYLLNTRLQMGHEELVRPLPMGTNWQTLRIGLRFCVNDTARQTFVSSTSQNFGFALALGVCQGNTSYFSDVTTDWIGGGYVGQTPGGAGYFNGQGAYTVGTPGYWTMNLARPNGVRKTGTSLTFGTESSVQFFLTGSGTGGAYAGQFMSGLYIDIIKGTPNYSVTVSYCNSAANAQVNITNAVFLANMETTASPSNTTSVAKTVAYSGAGLFDTVSVVNNRSWPHIEIDALAVSRFT